jgi:hypothetical protein
MTPEEILVGNKLIEDFMKQMTLDENVLYVFSELPIEKYPRKFHSSWDWLMPVVEKIEKIGETDKSQGYIDINSHHCEIGSMCKDQPDIIVGCYPTSPEEEKRSSKIEATYYAIIKFITWYNTTIK